MFSFKSLQTSLMLAALQLCLCAGAQAGESESSSEASVAPSTNATTQAASESSQGSSSEARRTNSTEAGNEASSESRSPSRPGLISGNNNNPALVPTIREVSKTKTYGSVPVRSTSSRKRSAHWKTQYWNQKSHHKTH